MIFQVASYGQFGPTWYHLTTNFVFVFRFIKKDDKIAILLDYDGTLAPLAAHPDLTIMEPESEAALKKLSIQPNVFLAVISGRAADNAKEKVGLDNITYAGNHGLEILYANGTKFQYEVSAELKSNFTKMVEELEEKVNIIYYVKLETGRKNAVTNIVGWLMIR